MDGIPIARAQEYESTTQISCKPNDVGIREKIEGNGKQRETQEENTPNLASSTNCEYSREELLSFYSPYLRPPAGFVFHAHVTTKIPVPPVCYQSDVFGNSEEELGRVRSRGRGRVYKSEYGWGRDSSASGSTGPIGRGRGSVVPSWKKHVEEDQIPGREITKTDLVISDKDIKYKSLLDEPLESGNDNTGEEELHHSRKAHKSPNNGVTHNNREHQKQSSVTKSGASGGWRSEASKVASVGRGSGINAFTSPRKDVFTIPEPEQERDGAKTNNAFFNEEIGEKVEPTSNRERERREELQEFDIPKHHLDIDGAEAFFGLSSMPDELPIQKMPKRQQQQLQQTSHSTIQDLRHSTTQQNILPKTISYTERMWYYRDPQGNEQGPFSAVNMERWMKTKYFTAELDVRLQEDYQFVPLAMAFWREQKNPFTGIPLQQWFATCPNDDFHTSMFHVLTSLEQHARAQTHQLHQNNQRQKKLGGPIFGPVKPSATKQAQPNSPVLGPVFSPLKSSTGSPPSSPLIVGPLASSFPAGPILGPSVGNIEQTNKNTPGKQRPKQPEVQSSPGTQTTNFSEHKPEPVEMKSGVFFIDQKTGRITTSSPLASPQATRKASNNNKTRTDLNPSLDSQNSWKVDSLQSSGPILQESAKATRKESTTHQIGSPSTRRIEDNPLKSEWDLSFADQDRQPEEIGTRALHSPHKQTGNLRAGRKKDTDSSQQAQPGLSPEQQRVKEKENKYQTSPTTIPLSPSANKQSPLEEDGLQQKSMATSAQFCGAWGLSPSNSPAVLRGTGKILTLMELQEQDRGSYSPTAATNAFTDRYINQREEFYKREQENKGKDTAKKTVNQSRLGFSEAQ